MLSLTRKIGETLLLGDNVVVKVRRISGTRVTLTIDAPRELRILRGELVEAVTAFEESPGLTNEEANSVAQSAVQDGQSIHETLPAEPLVVSQPPQSTNGAIPSL